ncbi:ATP-dependent Clp protease proteolytic subunit-related protein 2, chloroplastic-like [Musa acuminata AAA Group]|uniref:ATP-dependent Clp protease proteolytic subunit-related protein 2, chloroplastic-like n=1 Tax=Musa acuminata AAA Group TaxID=214697 RepID=UPI0031D7D9F2
MAVSLQSTSLRPLALDPKPSLSLTSKSFVGLKSQSSGAFGYGPPNVSAGFHCRVHQSLFLRHRTKRGSQGRIFMMPIGTPRVPYRTPGEGTWQWVDLWNALYRERVIFIGEHIDEEFCNQVLATMLYLDSIESSKKMYLYINGPGGDLTPSMAIYDTMQSLKSPVATHCIGHAYNMAGFLLAAGEKGSRVGMPLCRVTLQPPAGAARGQADDIRNEANELLRIRDYLFGELAKKTGQPVEKINKDLSYVKRFNAQEALEYGLIDRILRPARIKADAPRKETAQQGQA